MNKRNINIQKSNKSLIYLLICLMCITSFAAAGELHNQSESGMNGSVWKKLENMDQSEKENSEIELIIENSDTDFAQQIADNIEELWNEGEYTEALSLFSELEKHIDLDKVALSNSWRIPVPTEERLILDTDIRIGNRKDIYDVEFDISSESGNLFTVLLYHDDSEYSWSMNYSSDGGETWAETYVWTTSFYVEMISISATNSNCYVAYIGDSEQTSARIRRFKASDGSLIDFPNSETWIEVFSTNPTDPIREVSLTSAQTTDNEWLYYLALTSQGDLKYYIVNPSGVSFTEISTDVTDASRGLDVSFNELFEVCFLYVSYIDQFDSLHIDGSITYEGIWTGTWTTLKTCLTGTSSAVHSSISAYHDTVFCFFEYGQGDELRSRYVISYNGGSNWYNGWVPDTSIYAITPDVAIREGGGAGVVYHSDDPLQGYFFWRDYGGWWDTPEVYTEYNSSNCKPSIKYLGADKFGVIYISNDYPVNNAAYFHCIDKATSVDEETDNLPSSVNLLQNFPNPFNTSTIISYDLETAAYVTINIFNMLGQRIETLVDETQSAGTYKVIWSADNNASGTYFYAIQAGNYNASRMMTLIK